MVEWVNFWVFEKNRSQGLVFWTHVGQANQYEQFDAKRLEMNQSSVLYTFCWQVKKAQILEPWEYVFAWLYQW